MSNQIPESYDPLVQLLEDAADGANKYGAAIGLKQNTEATIRTDLTALIGVPAGPGGVPPAVPGLKSLWNMAKAGKVAMTASLRTAESNGRAQAMTCISSLKPVLGQQWNSAWNAAGFTAGSLAVPTHPRGLLLQLRAYYAVNPAREVKDINGVTCTAVACQAAADAIGTADTASNQSNTDAGNAQSALQDGIAAGRARGSGLLTELDQMLDDNDPRWLAFGFDMPGHPSVPDVPQNITVSAGAAGTHTLFINWGNSRRADGYRATISNAADGTVLASQLTQDTEVSIGNLLAGANVNVTVSARDAAGESQSSAPVAAVVP